MTPSLLRGGRLIVPWEPHRTCTRSVYWLGVREGLSVAAAADDGKEGGGSGSSE